MSSPVNSLTEPEADEGVPIMEEGDCLGGVGLGFFRGKREILCGSRLFQRREILIDRCKLNSIMEEVVEAVQ